MSDGGGNRWLREHFHEFVFPAFVAAEKRTTEIGKPFHVKAAPDAPEHLPSELKKLWTLCMEMKVPWEFDVREIGSHGGHSKYRESARIHHRIIVDTLDSTMAAIRDEGCSRLFLGGRDVWTFAVCAARRRIPFLFIPELSRYVTSKPSIRQFLESRGFTGQELFLDTGFAGSIPRNLQRHWPGLNFHFRLMSQSDVAVVHQEAGLVDADPIKEGVIRKAVAERWRRRPQQLFPNRKKAREEALETEYLAKYWKTGTYEYTLQVLAWAPQEVFDAWRERPNLFKFTKKPGYVHLCDGKEVAEFSLADAQRLDPRLLPWLDNIPQRNPPEEQVVQFFSDRRTIQRAALLTSMLWRGIPFWKAAMSREEKRKAQQWSGGIGNAILNPAGINQLQMQTAGTYTLTATNFATTGTNATIYTTNNIVGFSDMNMTNSGVMTQWPPTASASTALTSASSINQEKYLAAAAAQYVGQPLNDQTKHQIAALANAMAQADQAMQATPKCTPEQAMKMAAKKAIQDALNNVPLASAPAPLPPSEPWPQLPPAPIKPAPIIVLEPTLDDVDAGWDFATA